MQSDTEGLAAFESEGPQPAVLQNLPEAARTPARPTAPAGHLRVAVSAERVKVEYVRSFLPKDETAERKQGMVAHAYEVKSRVS